jgi:hypothetical protein
MAQVAFVLSEIEKSPEKYPIIKSQTRRTLLHRFPYGIFYLVSTFLFDRSKRKVCKRKNRPASSPPTHSGCGLPGFLPIFI